jgi:amino acid permease
LISYRRATFNSGLYLTHVSSAQKWAIMCEICLLLYLIGACIGYMIIIGNVFPLKLTSYTDGHLLYSTDYPDVGDMGESVWRHFVHVDGFLQSREFVIIAFSAVIIFPLCFLTRVDILGPFRCVHACEWGCSMSGIFLLFLCSCLAIVSCFYLVGFVSYEGIRHIEHWRFDGVKITDWNIEFFSAFPIIVFAYQCHIIAPTVYSELRHHTGMITWLEVAGVAQSSTIHLWQQ